VGEGRSCANEGRDKCNYKIKLTIRIKRSIIDNEYSELKKLLRLYGCYKVDEGSNHEEWFSPITNQPFYVGRHNSEDVRKGTYHAILKQAGIKR